MAYKLVQDFAFDKVDYSYDPQGDVLDISFGPPAPAIALQIEDWLAIQMRIQPPGLQGITMIGFKKIFEKINRYMECELPERMQRLASAKLLVAYDDESDTLNMQIFEVGRKIPSSDQETGVLTVFESLNLASGMGAKEALKNIYIERSLPSKDIVGIKIMRFTEFGLAALESFIGAIVDTLFEPRTQRDEKVHLITNTLVQRLDWQSLAAHAI